GCDVRWRLLPAFPPHVRIVYAGVSNEQWAPTSSRQARIAARPVYAATTGTLRRAGAGLGGGAGCNDRLAVGVGVGPGMAANARSRMPGREFPQSGSKAGEGGRRGSSMSRNIPVARGAAHLMQAASVCRYNVWVAAYRKPVSWRAGGRGPLRGKPA